jgi:hypothetical protein
VIERLQSDSYVLAVHFFSPRVPNCEWRVDIKPFAIRCSLSATR